MVEAAGFEAGPRFRRSWMVPRAAFWYARTLFLEVFAMPAAAIALVAVLVAAPSTMGDEPVHLKAVPKGGMEKLGYYAPQRLTLSAERPATLTTAPEGLGAPMYGVVKMGPDAAKTFHVVLDEPE